MATNNQHYNTQPKRGTHKIKKLNLKTLKLEHGAHNSPEEGLCITEAVAYFAGLSHTDTPECVCPSIAAFLRSWNDTLDSADRQLLKPYIPKVVGTKSTREVQLKRSWLAVDWLIRSYTPAWLELAGLSTEASELRSLSEITDTSSLERCGGAAGRAKGNAFAADSTTCSNANGAVRCTAGIAYNCAADRAARCAAYDTSRCVVNSNTYNAAYYAACCAAESAACCVALSAADSATGSAAYSDAYRALEPVAKKLQQSAFGLLDRMIAVV